MGGGHDRRRLRCCHRSRSEPGRPLRGALRGGHAVGRQPIRDLRQRRSIAVLLPDARHDLVGDVGAPPDDEVGVLGPQLGDERQPGSALRLRDSLVGLVTVLAVGPAYGYGLAHFTASPYADCGQSSPGMAPLGAFAGGVVVGLFVLPLVAHGLHRLTVTRTGVGSDVRWFLMVGVAILGAVAGFLLHTALWRLPIRVSC